jgi:hypothetical protein
LDVRKGDPRRDGVEGKKKEKKNEEESGEKRGPVEKVLSFLFILDFSFLAR